jgi:hypothetical protein
MLSCTVIPLRKAAHSGRALYANRNGRLTPQLSGGALRCEARRERIKWRARGAPAIGYDGPLQLLVRCHRGGRRMPIAKTFAGSRFCE